MATQRVMLAKIAGDAASILLRRFEAWPPYDSKSGEEPTICTEVDEFIERLRTNAHTPPVVYFMEWTDMWSMGDLIPGLGCESARVVVGNRFEVCLHVPPVEVARRTIAGSLTQECKWLRARIREADDAWKSLVGEAVFVVAREPLGGSVLDEEIEASLRRVPDWLSK